VPRPVAGLEGRVEALTAGAFHTCALHADQLSCWGANGSGQLGRSGADRSHPVGVSGLAAAGPLAAGADHTCVGRADGRLACFGGDAFGQLGDGRVTSPRSRPAEIGPVAAWDRGVVRDRNGDGTLTIGCVGDSNTERGFRFTRTWCERLGDLLGAPGYATVNRGWSGATAIFAPSLRRAEDPLDYALAFDELDAVILALGTNDLLQRATPEDIVLAYLRHLLRAREFGVDTFVALTPPMQGRFADQLPAIHATNELLRASIPSGRLIDFFSGVTAAELSDELHLNEAGQDRRARAALAVLRPDDS
jgi:lysophospholipase L1-like esterase